jgi:hypothetical protein
VRTSAFRLPSCLYEKRGGSVGERRGGGGAEVAAAGGWRWDAV